jgi:thiol-disulfide isomerase/thioredoxin
MWVSFPRIAARERLFDMRLVTALLLVWPALRAAERCDVPPALARLQHAAIKDRLAQAPDDFTLNRLFVDSSVYERKAERARYIEMLARHPGSLDYQYLRARSLVGSNTPEALRIYSQILEKDPDYPWVHLSQLEIFWSPSFRDRKKLEASFETFTRVCPSSFAPYRWLGELPDEGGLVRAAARLRAMLKDATNDQDLVRYSVLWSTEFRVRPKSEEDDEKRQIAEDLKRLLTLESSPSIRAVIENGAKLAGNAALEKRMAAQRPPDVNTQRRAWEKAHPYPKSDDPAEVKRAYGQAKLAESAKWREVAPEREIGYSERLDALLRLDAPDEEILRAADEFLAVFRKDASPSSNMDVIVPRAFVTRGISLDRVPALVEEMVTRFSDPEAVISIDLAPDRRMTEQRMMLVANSIDALLSLVQAYQKLGQNQNAHETIRRMEEMVASHRPAVDETDQQVLNWYNIARFSTWDATADLAEKEGRKLDALSAYREAQAVLPMMRNDRVARMRRLWKELGGSDEGWSRMVEAIPNPSVRTAAAPAVDTAVNRRLAAMSAKDTAGELWTLDRLKGKTTIAVVWATWCTPCVAELPYFAKLAERVKGREDVLAISFNTDDNIALAESFMKKREYRFPAISAKQYAEDLMPFFSIPRTWIIKNGVIVAERSGFGGDGDKWVEEMLALLKEPIVLPR